MSGKSFVELNRDLKTLLLCWNERGMKKLTLKKKYPKLEKSFCPELNEFNIEDILEFTWTLQPGMSDPNKWYDKW
jgi:hypothetical protein